MKDVSFSRWTVLALGTLALACGAAANGCSMESKLVCGDDGFTYQNACLAQSQGVNVVQDKPCSDRTKSAKATPVNFLATNCVDTAGSVTTAVIERFKNEGFKMVGRVELVDAPLPVPTVDSGSQLSGRSAGPLIAARITPTGHLYLQPEAAAKRAAAAVASRMEAGSPPFRPSCATASSTTSNTTTPNSRKLLVWAADKRVRVMNATYPYSAVGQIVGVSSSWLGYTCSGALFLPSYVLTAGHCVQSFKGDWSRNLNFYPGRLSKSATKGVYDWVWATSWWASGVYFCKENGTCSPRAFYNDYAVIKLSKAVGKRTGYLGLKSDLPWDEPVDALDKTMTSAGYPSGKPFGTMWRTNGKFAREAEQEYWDSGVYTSYLDVDPGQFGSLVWDSTYTTWALVNGMDIKGRAYHRIITREMYDVIMSVVSI